MIAGNTHRHPDRSRLAGVCAHIAARTGISLTLVRVVFVLLGLIHPWVMLPLYAVLALWLHGAFAQAAPRDRYSDYDARLRRASDAEAELRRQFRDLGGREK